MKLLKYNLVSQNNNRGFFKIIGIVVVVAVLLSIFGINPLGLWTDVIVPILITLWESLLAVITFIIGIVEAIMNSSSS